MVWSTQENSYWSLPFSISITLQSGSDIYQTTTELAHSHNGMGVNLNPFVNFSFRAIYVFPKVAVS